jgi:hypothetical protein
MEKTVNDAIQKKSGENRIIACPVTPLRTIKALCVIILVTLIGTWLVGIVFYISIRAFTK